VAFGAEPRRGERLGKVGLEPELFPIRVDCRGRAAGRVRLEGSGGVVETLDGLAACEARVGSRRGPDLGPWEYPLGSGGRLTFEPGGQIELSTAVYDTAAEALDDVQRVVDMMHGAFRARGALLVAAGVDVWNPLDQVPQQLRAGRYTAMAEYYDRRGPWGRVMMRHTTSLQVNLDLGPEQVWQERWLLANLVSPLITASFACSPDEGWVCERARAWQELDPTRSGFPAALVDGSSNDPRQQWAEAALAADVLLFRHTDGTTSPGQAGFSFARWITHGHPVLGWPTIGDLDYHLTTLFLEVRPRGFLELRAGEALPDRLRAAPVVLLTSLLYDDRARSKALEALDSARGRLPELWRRAARLGVRDPELGSLAAEVWEAALEGALRLPAGFFGEQALCTARRFLDQYTLRGRMPADDLGELLADDPSRALAWASVGQRPVLVNHVAG
jgi:glutamate--cysteine ligase